MPKVPGTGGRFERLAGVMKASLASSLLCRLPTYEEFQIIIYERQALINNNTFTYLSNEPDLELLTLSHLMRGCMIEIMPPFNELLERTIKKDGYVLRHCYHMLTITLQHLGYRKSGRQSF